MFLNNRFTPARFMGRFSDLPVTAPSAPPGPSTGLINAVTVDQITDTAAQIAIDVTVGGGVIYEYVSLSSTPPDEVDWATGAGAVFFVTATLAAHSEGLAGPSGLPHSTTHFVHVKYVGADTSVSTLSVAFDTSAPDVTAPVLSNAAVEIVSQTALRGIADTTKPYGLVYWCANSDASDLTESQIRSGQNAANGAAVAFGVTAVSATATISFTAGSLSEVATTLSFFHEDDATVPNVSAIVKRTETPRDVALPILVGLEANAANYQTLDFTGSTSKSGGVMHWLAVPIGGAEPNAAQVIAGTDGDDIAAVKTISPVFAAGPQTGQTTGAAQNTTYDIYAVHVDGNVIANLSVVTRAAAPVTTPDAHIFQRWFHDGLSAGQTAVANGTFTDNYSDHLGGNNAVLFEADAQDASARVQMSAGQRSINFESPQDLRGAPLYFEGFLKIIGNQTGEPIWHRLRFLNVATTGTQSLDLTNAAAGAAGAAPWDAITVDLVGDGWLRVRGQFTFATGADANGKFEFRWGYGNGQSTVYNNTPGSAVAYSDFRFSDAAFT